MTIWKIHIVVSIHSLVQSCIKEAVQKLHPTASVVLPPAMLLCTKKQKTNQKQSKIKSAEPLKAIKSSSHLLKCG